MKNVRKIILFNLIMVLVLSLSGCKGEASKDDELEWNEGKSENKDLGIGNSEDEGREVDNDIDKVDGEINKYLLAVGMQCVENTIQTLKNRESYLIGPQQEQILESLEMMESINAVLIPYNPEELVDLMDIEDNRLICLKEYVSPSEMVAKLGSGGDWSRYASMNFSTVVMPDYEGQEWILPIFFGDMSSPDAGIFVCFQYVRNNNIIYIESWAFDKNMAQYLLNECSEWLEKGICYNEEDILEAEENFNMEQLDVPISDVEDINKFLIEMAVTMNNQFYMDLISDDFIEYVSSLSVNALEEVEYISDSINSFDIGIIMPGFHEYDNQDAYPEFRSDVFTVCLMPENWIEDTAVILGNQSANNFALIYFEKLSDYALGVSYKLISLEENRKFTTIKGILKEKGVYLFESPYGTWDEYVGIKNLDNIEAAIDPDDFYDYLLCSGDGYSLVAKQEENVTDVIEYIGVLDADFNWIVSLSDNTCVNTGGYITRRWTGYSDYENRCESVSNVTRYAGDGVFVIGEVANYISFSSDVWYEALHTQIGVTKI